MPNFQASKRPDPLRADPRLSYALLAVLVSGLAILPGCAAVKPPATPTESVDLAVEHMLHAVGEAAKISGSRFKDSDLELTELSMTLETIAKKTASDELTLWVVTFDRSREKDFTQSVTVLLKPPGKATKKAVMTEKEITAPNPDLVKGLTSGFDAAYLAARGASEGLAMSHSGDATLETNTITVEIDFTVTGSSSISPTITISDISLVKDPGRSRENDHKITMTFTNKATAADDSKKST